MTGIHFKHKRASLICNEFYEGIWFFLKFPNRNIYDCFLFCMVKDYMNYWTQFSSLLLELINSNKWMTFIFNFFLSVVGIYQFQFIKTVTQIVKDCLARANSKGFSSIAVPDLGSPLVTQQRSLPICCSKLWRNLAKKMLDLHSAELYFVCLSLRFIRYDIIWCNV